MDLRMKRFYIFRLLGKNTLSKTNTNKKANQVEHLKEAVD